MSEECTHDCSTCHADCSSRKEISKEGNAKSQVKKVISVVSGKGGVGKSIVTSMLAVLLQRKGYKVGILDADITGPSIPQAFGMHHVNIYGEEGGMLPATTKTGIDMMSVNLLLGEEETKPVVWRGSLIAGTVGQFWKETIWNCDVLLVDCPPGTGDVPLTVFQTMPVDGIVIVSSPQQLVSMIVQKAANMAEMMDIPVLGLVENMSYVKCPDCGKEIKIFGESGIEHIAEVFNYSVLAKIPMDAELAHLVDNGKVEDITCDYLNEAANEIEKKLGLKK